MTSLLFKDLDHTHSLSYNECVGKACNTFRVLGTVPCTQMETGKTLSLESTQLLYATDATRKPLRQFTGHFIPFHQMSLYFLYTLLFSLPILCLSIRFVRIYS